MENGALLFLRLLALVVSLFTMHGAQAALTINNDGTVTDPTTGLTWMRCSMGQTWDGSTCTGTPSTYTFDQANALTTAFAGKSDWRMPNIRELQTIVNRSVYNPAIDSAAFPNTPDSDFWSGSPYASSSGSAWGVNFTYGLVSNDTRSSSFAVRLVRGGQSFGSLLGIMRPTSDYVDNGDGTVTHTPTNLTWKRCSQGQTWTGSTCSGSAINYYFDKAYALTGTTTFADQSDWRVPTEDELLSLVDYSIAYPGPAINRSLFPALPAAFWSGSPYSDNSDYAWRVVFSDGRADSLRGGNGSFAVRLVRGGQSLGSFVLTVARTGAGTGTVSSTPAGISCGSTCNASFASGTNVTLTATPTTGSIFTGWSGACSGTGSCTVSMSASVTATFATSVTAPVCTLSANSASITAGSSSTLTASCNPAATSYTWTGGTCADTTSATCTVTPTSTTTYSVTGTNAGGTGTAASAAVTVNPCTYALGATSVAVAAIASTGNVSVTSSCAWTAASNVSWLTITSGASSSGNGSVAYTVAANTGSSSRAGTLTIAGQTFPVTQAGVTVAAPVCTLSASPSSFTVGGSSTLTTSCSPAATSYTWTGGTCAGTTGATCTVTPTSTTTYSVTGTNAGGTGTAASATVTVNACTYGLGASSASVAAIASSGSVSVTSTCAWTATSDASWLTITSGASGSGNGSVTYTVAANTGTSARTGTLTIAGKTFTVTQAAGATVVTPPVCTLSATPPTINAGSISILTATCDPAASTNLDGYTWTGGTCTVTTGSTCTVTPSTATTYTVTGFNTVGTGNTASAVVRIAGSASSTVPGTLEDDFFLPSGNNSYYGGAGNDTYIISPSTLRGAVTAKIIDTEGTNIVQLVNGMTITSSSFFMDAAQLMLSNGAIVQVLGASKFIYQLGVDILAGETASNLNFAQFAAKLGASVPAAGAAAVSGTANFVVVKQ